MNRKHRVGSLDKKLTVAQIQQKIKQVDDTLPKLRDRLHPCTLCPRRCGALRLSGEVGECGLDSRLCVASVARHLGEEPPISGDRGAINIFFSGCNLHCLYCQNWPISQRHVGGIMTPEALADAIIKKWRQGAHTLGWVTPTAQIVGALSAYGLCLQQGFDLPVVHNNGGYEDEETIELLAGIVDIWLPDAKTHDKVLGEKTHSVADYPEKNLQAIRTMVNQMEQHQARGVIVRHLALPGRIDDSLKVLDLLWHEFGSKIYLSLMGQYFPFFTTETHPTLNRRLDEPEYQTVIEHARQLGFIKGWVQEREEESGIPFHCLP